MAYQDEGISSIYNFRCMGLMCLLICQSFQLSYVPLFPPPHDGLSVLDRFFPVVALYPVFNCQKVDHNVAFNCCHFKMAPLFPAPGSLGAQVEGG